MWFILAVSLLAFAIAIERYLALTIRFGLNARHLFNETKKYILANDWKRALDLCRHYPYAPVAQVLGAGIAHADQKIEEMETAMESEALYHVPKVTARIGYLSVLANIATLLGLLGTIQGLIASFFTVGGGVMEGVTREEALASGIAIAMFTTAFGLIVAIPTMLAHAFLSSKANALVGEIEHYSTALKKLIQQVKATQTIEFSGLKEQWLKGEMPDAKKGERSQASVITNPVAQQI